ncbi:Acyl-coenzyme A thioesterase 13-like protein [Drosera capensis]
MDRAKQMLEPTGSDTEIVNQILVLPHRANIEPSFYEDFALRGIRVDRVEAGLVACSLKVPARLTDSTGNLSPGAIVNLVDEVGSALIYKPGLPMNVSVNMSVSFVSSATVNDELGVTSRLLGRNGNLVTAVVVIKKKGTEEIVAEGRHTIFCKHASKI